MESFNKTIMAILLLLLITLSMADAQMPSCASKLVPCANYLNSTKPGDDCCTSIKQAVATELPCLCNLYNSPGVLQSFGVTVAQALRLTQSCGVPVKLDQCKSSAPSPQTQPPPGVPGGDGNGAERAVWTGMSSLLLLFVSVLLY